MIGTLALTGVGIPGSVFGFAGFFSKDAIVEAAYGFGGNLGAFSYWLLVIAAAFTSFYSWRLVHMTFHGQPKGDGHAYEHAHESPMVMLIPLGVLAVGAVFAGWLLYAQFFGHPEHITHFFGNSLVVGEKIVKAAHDAPTLAKLGPTIAMLLGFITAWVMYITRPDLPAKLANRMRGLYLFLLNKWYFDELYDAIFVRPAFRVGRFLWRSLDDRFIDKTVVEGTGDRVRDITARVVRMQSGYLYHYAFAMLIGVALLLTWMILAGGRI